MKAHPLVRVMSLCSSASLLAALTACVSLEGATRDSLAVAALIGADAQPAGSARLYSEEGVLVLEVAATGLSPGSHGLHLHTTGRCDPPEFTSAGGHWNPTERQHGAAAPAGPHAGDLPDLVAGANGRASLRVPLNDQAQSAGPSALLDADGAAVMIHAGPDDMRSDPSGNSGARVACGILVRR